MVNKFLYHGSNQVIEHPICDIGAKGRDFGVCFYTTYSKKTASDWANKNFKEKSVVNRYSVDLEQLSEENLKIKRFSANAEWAEFVWRNRYDERFTRPNYDIIIGPMADIVLLNLLRIALGNSTEWKVEGSVDWLEVIIRAICSKY